METNTAYQSYLNSMKNYETPQGRKDYQAPFSDNFENIYNKAKEEDITLSTAKEFLETLSSTEMKTLQKYSGLADDINVDSISAEGAYNLLLHDKERYDFNSDGVADVGAAQTVLPVPINMPTDVRDAYISAMNSLSGKDRLIMTSMLTLDPARLKSIMNNEPYTPTKMDYNYLKTQVQNSLNPKGGAFTSDETKKSIRAFWDAFDSSYKGDKTQTNTQEQSSEVAQFLKDLRTKGAVQFLADLNEEKIDKLVEKFKEKLTKEMGDSPQALKDIAKLVEEYKKQLMDDMKDKMDDKSKNEGEYGVKISSDSIVQMMLDMQQAKAPKPLEELLLK